MKKDLNVANTVGLEMLLLLWSKLGRPMWCGPEALIPSSGQDESKRGTSEPGFVLPIVVLFFTAILPNHYILRSRPKSKGNLLFSG
jgi:hypothetical protein